LIPFTILPVSLTVTAPCQAIADLSADYTPFDPSVGEVVTFTASASGTLPITYTWVFEDGSTVIAPEVTYMFDRAGMHVVVLSGQNTCGTEEMNVNVLVEAIIQRTLLPVVTR
jgi:hypothetical protein